jgi:predicted Fe-S protein YdhL (DUF1289 family)
VAAHRRGAAECAVTEPPGGPRSEPRASLPPPLSPCTKVCVVERSSGLCQGCRRSLAEIAAWWTLSDAQKREVLADLPRRR